MWLLQDDFDGVTRDSGSDGRDIRVVRTTISGFRY